MSYQEWIATAAEEEIHFAEYFTTLKDVSLKSRDTGKEFKNHNKSKQVSY
jgi:hypothetical protein